MDGRTIYQETNKRMMAGGLGSNEFQVLVKPYVKTNIRMELLWWKEGVGPLFSPDPSLSVKGREHFGKHCGYDFLVFF